MLQKQHNSGRPSATAAAVRVTVLGGLLAALLLPQPATAGSPAASSARNEARPVSQFAVPPGNVPAACVVNGLPLQPTLRAGNTWAWAFGANFDHNPSHSQTNTCLALRHAADAGTVLYFPSNAHCIVMNPNAGARFGDGIARFASGAFLRCTLALPANWRLPPFATQARVSLPTLASNSTHTVLSAPSLLLKLDSQASVCQPTISSTYASATISDPTALSCATWSQVKFMLDRDNVGIVHGWHRVGTTVFAKQPMSLTQVQNASAFTFDIGAASDGSFSMDWIIIDPGNHSG